MDAEQSQITKYTITYFTLEISLLFRNVIIEMRWEFIAFPEILSTHITNIQTNFMYIFHVCYNALGFPCNFRFIFAQQAGIYRFIPKYNLKKKKHNVQRMILLYARYAEILCTCFSTASNFTLFFFDFLSILLISFNSSTLYRTSSDSTIISSSSSCLSSSIIYSLSSSTSYKNIDKNIIFKLRT